MFERTKAKIRLRRICKALGVEPYPEMVRYVIDRDETIFRGGRRNGKTLALIIDELVYKRVPPALFGCLMECRFCKDPDYWKMPRMSRDRFYISELMRAVQRCETAGIDVGRGKRDYKRSAEHEASPRKTPEMAVRVRLPEMRQHSRGTRPTQGQRRRLLHPMYRAHGQPPPEPDTRR